MMVRILRRFALASLLIVGLSAGTSAQTLQQSPPSAAPRAETGKNAVPGLPEVTFEEIVGPPPHPAGYSLTAIALGAVAGVVAVNWLIPVLGYQTAAATVGGVPVTAATLESALATSRLYAVGSAVAGGAVGQMLYSAFWH